MHALRLSVLALVATGAVACGGSVSDDPGHTSATGGATSTGGTTAAGGTTASGGTGGTSNVGGTGGGTSVHDCSAEANALAAKYSGIECTSVLRLDRELQFAVTGYDVLCGTYAVPVDETEAAATAFADTGYGTQCGGSLIPADPGVIDELLFYHPASAAACACCGDGWIAAVSAGSGISVFGAGLPVTGQVQVTFPKTWGSPADLGSPCANPPPLPSYLRGYDLSGTISSPATSLDPATMGSALASVYATALPRAAQQAGHAVTNAVVLQYVAKSGEDLIQHDVIVLLNSHVVLP